VLDAAEGAFFIGSTLHGMKRGPQKHQQTYTKKDSNTYTSIIIPQVAIVPYH